MENDRLASEPACRSDGQASSMNCGTLLGQNHAEAKGFLCCGSAAETQLPAPCDCMPVLAPCPHAVRPKRHNQSLKCCRPAECQVAEPANAIARKETGLHFHPDIMKRLKTIHH